MLGVQGIEEAGTRLAQTLTKKENIAKMKASMPADVAKSLARVSGGLYVITAANKSARGAMLASWVAQASFEPLGLTVAVAKDRAIESLMQVSRGRMHACPCSLETVSYDPQQPDIVQACIFSSPDLGHRECSVTCSANDEAISDVNFHNSMAVSKCMLWCCRLETLL